MTRLSLRNNQLKFKTSGKVPIILDEFVEYAPIYKRKPENFNMSPAGLANTRISTYHTPKISPITASREESRCQPGHAATLQKEARRCRGIYEVTHLSPFKGVC